MPIPPQCPREIALPTLPLTVLQGAAVSSKRFSQSLPPGNIAALRGSPPLRGFLEQLERPSPAGPPLQGTELAALSTPEACLERLVPLVDYLAAWKLLPNVSRWVLHTVEKGPSSPQRVRGLQPVLHHCQEGWRVASYSRSASIEPLSHATEVQDALYRAGCVSDQVRGLVCHDRSKRRILPHLHPSPSQGVPVPIPGSSFQPCTLTPHFHEVCGYCSGRATYLGVVWDLITMQARLSPAQIESILTAVARVREGRSLTVKQFQKLLGLMAAASNVISFGLLYMRPPQWWLKTKGFSPRGNPLCMLKVT